MYPLQNAPLWPKLDSGVVVVVYGDFGFKSRQGEKCVQFFTSQKQLCVENFTWICLGSCVCWADWADEL